MIMSVHHEMMKVPPPRAMLWGIVAFLMLHLLWGCDYGRMKEDEAVHTYQTSMPEMLSGTIPTGGGIQVLRTASPDQLPNPAAFSAESVQRGKEAYGFYCIHCHGPYADGRGTVGQSFAPLPANLKDPNVQDQSDGSLFYRISLGFKRHPPLWHTVTEDNRWAIINYVRSLARPEKS
jgi:mono/diheme cytochrome c family protein